MRPELLRENTYLLRSASVWITTGCGLAAPIARGRNADTAVAAPGTHQYRPCPVRPALAAYASQA